ncbi:MAG: hexitol phosphatase HxpB [Deltaproteobacteria bacterium]|nr:hexitol phosphatase HxpB [Deltaproteobacteria bacterium]
MGTSGPSTLTREASSHGEGTLRADRLMFDAVVFDMDGVLVNSEPLWHEAEIEVFGALGVTLTAGDCQQTTGVRVDGVVKHWRKLRPERFADVDDDAVVSQIVRGVIDRIAVRGAPMDHAIEAVDDVAARGLRLGLASSSPMGIIDAVLARLGVRARFSAVCSAEHLPRGKPDPAVYLQACTSLGVEPARAIAVEDSSSGIRAGKNAGMFVLAVPDPAAAPPEALAVADVVIGSLRELPAILDRLRR